MAKSNRNFFYGMEDDDVGGLGFDELGKADVDPIDEAGDDSETRDVSTGTTKETAHNEAASAGGIVVGDNAADITIDPVGATEALIRRTIGLSREDLEEIEEQLEASPEPAALTETPSTDEVDNLTTVNVVAPAGASTVVDSDSEEPVDVVPEPDTAAAVAGVEFLYRIQSREDEDMEGSDSDVEFDVKTPNNDVNFEMKDKAVTIEPNSDGDMGGDEGSEPPAESEPEEPAEPEGEPEGGEGEPEGEPEGGAPEGSEESWFRFM